MFSGTIWLFSETTDSEFLKFELKTSKNEIRKFTIVLNKSIRKTE